MTTFPLSRASGKKPNTRNEFKRKFCPVPITKSPSLSNLQQWMRWVLSHPNGVGAAIEKPHALKNCLMVIGETPEVNRQTRLSIYGNGYFWRLIEGLGSTFSSVKNVLGLREFNDVARAYLVKHPSTF